MDYKSRGLLLRWPVWNNPANACWQRCSNDGLSFSVSPHPIDGTSSQVSWLLLLTWATIYTMMWYHPMESTVSPVLGLFRTGLLLVYQSLIFTPMHMNEYWRLIIEVWVTIHSAVTATQIQDRKMMGIFLFGLLCGWWCLLRFMDSDIRGKGGIVKWYWRRWRRGGGNKFTQALIVRYIRPLCTLLAMVPAFVYFTVVVAVY